MNLYRISLYSAVYFMVSIDETVSGVGGLPMASANNFSSIAANVTTSIRFLPGLLTGLAYLLGIIIGVKAIIMIKEHVEKPLETPLQGAVIRFAAGGALLALPIVFESMYETIGSGNNASAAALNRTSFNVS